MGGPVKAGRSVACSECGAAVGRPCVRASRGHAARIRAAADAAADDVDAQAVAERLPAGALAALASIRERGPARFEIAGGGVAIWRVDGREIRAADVDDLRRAGAIHVVGRGRGGRPSAIASELGRRILAAVGVLVALAAVEVAWALLTGGAG